MTTGLVRDGNFQSITTACITTGNIVTGNLTVTGTLTANIVGSGNISDGSLTINKMKPDLFTVPYYNGQKVNIHENINTVNLRATFINRYPDSIIFSNDGGATVQIWINYYDEDDNTLYHGESGAFFPESSNINAGPLDLTIAPEASYSYDIVLNNIHYNKPEAAKYWSLTIRPVSINKGTMSVGQCVIVDRFTVTPWNLSIGFA